MNACFRILILLSMVLMLCATTPQNVAAQAPQDGGTSAMPAGLQEAFLASSMEPFSTHGGAYTTEYNGLDYTLDAKGLQAEGNEIQWGISLRGMGRGNQAADVQAPEIVQTDDRLEYRRGALTEWYRDTVLGVEQGFTIYESPQGNGKLVLHLDLFTELEGQLNKDERGISFAGVDGQTLRYDNLKAYDANGAELEAKMVYNPAQVVIHVDDREAIYPITIDPLIYLEQKAIALDGEVSDQFGASVAIDGDTALVGVQRDDVDETDQGSVYVFVRDGTTWALQARLTAADGAEYDYFGCSVALSGQTALVGARYDDVGANGEQGSAYVFVRSGTTWTQQQQLTASDGVALDGFGYSVALSGDTALVGAHLDDDNKIDQGSAYVFVRSGTTWIQQQKLTASDGDMEDYFGFSVALSGDNALVGAFWDDVGEPSNMNQGSAYVFVRSGTTWTQQTQLTAGAADDYFGSSVALSGDTALVGAPGRNSIRTDSGSAYVFTRSGTVWTQQEELVNLYATTDGDEFGSSVALSGDTALVGTWQADVDVADQGSAFIFTRSGTIWSQQERLTASDHALEDKFGSSVALSSDTALVGAYLDDVGANSNQGSAYFYQAYRTDADLAVSVGNGSGTTLYSGDTTYFTVSVTNYGPSTATAVMLAASLPKGLTYVSHAVTRGIYTPETSSWAVGNLPLGVSATLYLEATAAIQSAPTTTLTFSARSLSRDSNDTNNSANLNLVVRKKERALNGGFNTYAGTSKIPTGWTASKFATTDGKDTTTTNRKEGTAAVKIANTTAKTKTLSQTFPISGYAGDSFILSYWVKGKQLPATGLCQIQVMFYKAGLVGATTLPCDSKGTFVYKNRTMSFTAPGPYTSITIRVTYSKASGTAWFDAVSLLR